MSSKQLVLDAIAHKRMDEVPYQINFTPDEHQKMAEYYGDADFLCKLGNAIDFVDPRPKKAVIRKNFVRDEFGVVFNKTQDKEVGVVEKYLVDSSNAGSFRFPAVDSGAYFDAFEAYSDKGKFNVAQFSHVFFERGWMLYGMENLLADMILKPKAVDTLMDRILEYFLKLLQKSEKYEFIDCCYFGDDWGQQQGLMMGPKMWRRYIKPRLKVLFDAVRAMNKKVYIHTCGDISEIMPDIIEIGVDIYDPFQPEVFDIFALKHEYGQDITFLGGVSLQNVLPFGSVADVREEVLKKLELAMDGGYIVGPSHAVTKDVPAQNMAEMIDILRNQSRQYEESSKK